eukprot:GHUV01003920.1.p1 GENE.GHUV01003920.1~~GHUV01003920.1.p1  ORF type:complete len:385 (+),score=76.80 GHUV01003920.1:295-1449(+)
MGKALAASAAAAAVLGAAAAVALIRKHSKRVQHSPIVLKNSDGVEVHILPIGATIQRLIVPTKDRNLDIVLGFNKASTYENLVDTPYFGAIVGRCANRIAKGRFKIDGQQYQLATNNGPNALHGGPYGFHRRVFTASAVEESRDGSAVTLTYTSPNGEEGYPGTLSLTVRYELLAHSAELRTTISATTDKATVVNIAQHSYFNLEGHDSGTILDHSVKIAADHYTPVDENQIPTGEILPVAGAPFDFFTGAHTVGERVDQVPGGNGYDHNYVLFGMGPQARFIVRNQAVSSTPRLAATVTAPSSHLKLELLTTAPGMQFYVGGFLGGDDTPDAKDGAKYPKFAGLCLETQSFPDAINQQFFPTTLLQPGETYKHEIIYRISESS